MLHAASLRMRDTASAWLTIAFNLAIGLGALVGGFLLDGFGIAVLPWAEVALIAVALAFVLVDRPSPHRGPRRVHPGHPDPPVGAAVP